MFPAENAKPSPVRNESVHYVHWFCGFVWFSKEVEEEVIGSEFPQEQQANQEQNTSMYSQIVGRCNILNDFKMKKQQGRKRIYIFAILKV